MGQNMMCSARGGSAQPENLRQNDVRMFSFINRWILKYEPIFSKVRNDLSENVFVPVILAKKIDVSFDFLSVK